MHPRGVCGASPSKIFAPDFVLPIAATAIDFARKLGIPTPIDANQARLGTRKIYFDCTKAWNELGRPNIDMLQSLRDTYDWYVEHGYMKA